MAVRKHRSINNGRMTLITIGTVEGMSTRQQALDNDVLKDLLGKEW
jgi:hypothetical protein